MNVTPVTPSRPFDVTAAFPQLVPLARTATRLHPRPGAPTWHDSSVGGGGGWGRPPPRRPGRGWEASHGGTA
ncbi:hypothetical protein ACFWJA_42655, partial [Streptomyces cadmiisoli]